MEQAKNWEGVKPITDVNWLAQVQHRTAIPSTGVA